MIRRCENELRYKIRHMLIGNQWSKQAQLRISITKTTKTWLTQTSLHHKIMLIKIWLHDLTSHSQTSRHDLTLHSQTAAYLDFVKTVKAHPCELKYQI